MSRVTKTSAPKTVDNAQRDQRDAKVQKEQADQPQPLASLGTRTQEVHKKS